MAKSVVDDKPRGCGEFHTYIVEIQVWHNGEHGYDLISEKSRDFLRPEFGFAQIGRKVAPD